MRRANFPPELDSLDSPLLSSNPLASATFGSIPGSALAERIFNDPHSWETEDNNNDDDIPADPVAWFVEEIEKFRLNSAASTSTDGTVFSPGMGDELEKIRVMPSPALTVSENPGLKGLRKNGPRPISLAAFFDAPGSGEEVQAHLSKLIDSGNAPPGVTKPLMTSLFSPELTPAQTSAASTSSSSLASPLPLYSASATLSFLEWYGIYPDSPRPESNMRKSIYVKSQPRSRPAPAIQIPSTPNRPFSIFSPSLLHPDLTVEPPKRDISVAPPLPKSPPRETVAERPASVEPHGARPRKETVTERPASVELVVARPSTPAGAQKESHASRPSPPASRVQSKPTLPAEPQESRPCSRQSSRQSPPAESPPRRRSPPGLSRETGQTPPRSLPYPMAPPPYTRTPSPLHSVVTESQTSSSPAPNQSPARPPPPATATIRRLPSIPVQAPPTTAPPQTQNTSAALPTAGLPSSLPTSMLSPEPTPGTQTIIFHSRPQSAVRSPLGGPIGPRSRASSGTKFTSTLSQSAGPRPSSGLARRPPVLQL